MSYQDEVKCENKEEIYDIDEKSLTKTGKVEKDIHCLTYNYNLDSAIVSRNIAMQVKILCEVII